MQDDVKGVHELEKVVVTSQRVERDAKDIPLNIDIIDEKKIKNLGAETISDLIKIIPNVSLQDILGDYTYFQVRGMPRNGKQSNFPVYVDGVPYTSLYGLNMSFLDVERVEVIRGPQGNLYGANARDGLLSITTRLPGMEPEGRIQLSSGNYDYRKFQFSGSSPIIEDVLFANLAIEQRKRDGFVENTFLNTAVDDQDDLSLRAGLYWEPNDTLNARLNLDGGKRKGGVYNYVPGSPRLDAGDDLKTAFNDEHLLDQKFGGGSFSIDWAFNPDWKLSSVSGLRKVDTFARFDADLSTLPYGYYDTWLDETDFFQELRLSSDPGSHAVDWLFGLSYFKNKDENRNQYPQFMNQVKGVINTDIYTAYSNAIWRFAPQWKLEAGLRYTYEDFNMDSHFLNPSLPVPSAETEGSISNSFSNWLPKAAISYDIDSNHTVYASYGEGMLSGGATWMQEDTSAAGIRKGHGVAYQPELSRSFELGYKAFLPESRSSVNVSLYQMDIEDYQHSYADPLFMTRITSIDRVRSKGAEASLSTWLTDNLTTTLSVGFNDARIDKLDSVKDTAALASVNKGDRIPNAPKYNASAQLNHVMPLNNRWEMKNNLSFNYFGETTFDFAGQMKQGSYGVVNLSTELEYSDMLSVRFWANNLLDERYQIYSINMGESELASYGNPRTFGIDLISRF